MVFIFCRSFICSLQDPWQKVFPLSWCSELFFLLFSLTGLLMKGPHFKKRICPLSLIHIYSLESWKIDPYSCLGTLTLGTKPLKLYLNLGQLPLYILKLFSSFLASGKFPFSLSLSLFSLLSFSSFLFKIYIYIFCVAFLWVKVKGLVCVISAYHVPRFLAMERKRNSR